MGILLEYYLLSTLYSSKFIFSIITYRFRTRIEVGIHKMAWRLHQHKDIGARGERGTKMKTKRERAIKMIWTKQNTRAERKNSLQTNTSISERTFETKQHLLNGNNTGEEWRVSFRILTARYLHNPFTDSHLKPFRVNFMVGFYLLIKEPQHVTNITHWYGCHFIIPFDTCVRLLGTVIAHSIQLKVHYEYLYVTLHIAYSQKYQARIKNWYN